MWANQGVQNYDIDNFYKKAYRVTVFNRKVHRLLLKKHLQFQVSKYKTEFFMKFTKVWVGKPRCSKPCSKL